MQAGMMQPGMMPAGMPVAEEEHKDAKTELCQFCQKCCKRPVTKQDIVYMVTRFGHQYQSIVKLNCFSGQEYAGHLCQSAKEAEKSAAEQALLANPNAAEVLATKTEPQKGRRKPMLTPTELAEKRAKRLEEGENAAITPKTKLNSLCMQIAKRYLQKGETCYESVKVSGGFQATVMLTCLPGEWGARRWAGEVLSSKQKAEQSAATIALAQLETDPELSEEAAKPKGKGRGKGKRDSYWSSWYSGWVWEGKEDEREVVGEEPTTGEVVEWKETHGWLQADEAIDRPAASFRGGKVYISKADLQCDPEVLQPGTKVRFILYEDPSGLGAAEVNVL